MMRLSLLLLCCLLVSPLALLAQAADQDSASPAHQKDQNPEEQTYQKQLKEYQDTRHRLQAQAKQAFDDEMAREKADDAKTGECKDANSTQDWNVCLGKESKMSEASYAAFTTALRALIALKMPVEDDSAASAPTGAPSPSDESAKEFDRLEAVWQQYRDIARKAAYDQYKGGSMGPSFALEVYLYTIRTHLRELDLIYGDNLHL